MQKSKWITRAFTGTLLLLSSATAFGEEYKIVLDRPEKVGQTYTINATGEAKQTATINVPGAEPQKQGETYTAQLEGTIKVLAVDEQSGQPVKVECTVQKLTRSDKSLADAGAVVTAENKDGQNVFTVNGMPADPDASSALELLLNTHQPGTPSDNKVFGTDKPQQVGATWPIDSQAAALGAEKSGLPISKDDIKGESKLVAVKQVDGKEALQIQAEMKVDKLAGAMPNGAKIDSGTVTAHFEGLFPTDVNEPPLSQSQEMKIHMKMTVNPPGGAGPVSVDTEVSRSSKATFGPAK